jgi:hypothetical protein
MTAPFGPPRDADRRSPLEFQGGKGGDLLIPLNCVRGQGV